ncbi:MAG: helix-turn-helix domain-containing protein [Lachnospiraceae bacterium]|nr:helix-turn-helix domain-containing protein [Lachnospiraceae bacterium]
MYNETTDLITIEDMCNILLIGRNSAYRLLKSKKIKAFRIGKVWKIPMSAIDEFILSESNLSKK